MDSNESPAGAPEDADQSPPRTDPLVRLPSERPSEAREDYAFAALLGLPALVMQNDALAEASGWPAVFLLFLPVPAMGIWYLIRRAAIVTAMADARMRAGLRVAGLSPWECLRARLAPVELRLRRCLWIGGWYHAFGPTMLVVDVAGKPRDPAFVPFMLGLCLFMAWPLMIGGRLIRSSLDEMVVEACLDDDARGSVPWRGALSLCLRFFVAGFVVLQTMAVGMFGPILLGMGPETLSSVPARRLAAFSVVLTMGIGIAVLVALVRRIRSRRRLAIERMESLD